MTCRLGIGFLGAGQATQAIHLPVLASIRDRFEIRWVMDVDSAVAGVVAGLVDAKAATDIAPVLDDPDVAIVVICSPSTLHAEQILATCAAGKKAILCEKPLAWNREEKELLKKLCGSMAWLCS